LIRPPGRLRAPGDALIEACQGDDAGAVVVFRAVGHVDDFGQLRDAYTDAWQLRGSGHPDPGELLIAKLDSLEDEVFSGPGPGRDVVLTLFERGVPPDSLRRELKRALPNLALSTVTSLATATRQIAGFLRRQEPPGGGPDDEGDPQGA
jgi:hypothetical protein